MELDQIRTEAAELFPLAVRFAIARPGIANPQLDSLNQLCGDNYARLGFHCRADCFAAMAPKLDGVLTLDAWCRADLMVSGWPLNVVLRPLYLGATYAHFQIRHNGPIPGVTETGCQSVFTPLATFAELAPEEYLSSLIGTHPREQQLTLF